MTRACPKAVCCYDRPPRIYLCQMDGVRKRVTVAAYAAGSTVLRQSVGRGCHAVTRGCIAHTGGVESAHETRFRVIGRRL